VLTKYVEPGEFVQQGQPLYKLAIVDSMELRAYVTEPQLAQVKIGQPAEVTVDAGPSHRTTRTGKVTWISSEAEFTPTPVQTREERADLVYAIKVVVPNQDGLFKIGMPADVRFTTQAEASK
jgi:HlyD family secretion protein